MKLEAQKAGCFATELKNNNCKLMKWLIQAHLANVSNIKIGFLSRTNVKDPYVHAVLAVTDHPTAELASELGVDMYQVWAATKYLIQIFQKLSEGSYIIMRDPNRKNMHLYKTSIDEFKIEQKKTTK